MFLYGESGWSLDYGLSHGKDIYFFPIFYKTCLISSPPSLNYSPIFVYFIFVKTSLLDVTSHKTNAGTTGMTQQWLEMNNGYLSIVSLTLKPYKKSL